MKEFSRYDIAQVIANEFDLIVSDIIVDGEFSDFKKDYEADEFDMMNLCANLETEFDIKIPPDTEKSWKTVDDVYRYMESAALVCG